MVNLRSVSQRVACDGANCISKIKNDWPLENEKRSTSQVMVITMPNIPIIYLFNETYLYRVDIISSQAIFHMCPVEILLYEKQTFNYIIYETGELYNTDKNVSYISIIMNSR